MRNTYFSMLCLGDSYTIGECVKLFESFPYQLVQMLRKNGMHFHAPEIVAVTGFTSDELMEILKNYRLNDAYDFVTILIGVNNQYRGLAIEKFANELEKMVKEAIEIANSKTDQVILISIPDWSVSPFAKDFDKEKVSTQLNAFNEVVRNFAHQYKTSYLDITTGSREALYDESLVASDGLHPSGKEYEKWAKALAGIIQNLLKR